MKALAIISLCLLGIACKKEPSPMERIQATLHDHFLKAVNDTEGYEFVSIEELDTLTNNEYRMQEAKFVGFKHHPESIAARAKLKGLYKQALVYSPNDYSYKSRIKELDAEDEEARLEQIKIDSLKAAMNEPDSAEIKNYTLMYKFRAKNKEGNKELYKYYVRLNPDLTFLSSSIQED